MHLLQVEFWMHSAQLESQAEEETQVLSCKAYPVIQVVQVLGVPEAQVAQLATLQV